MAETLDAVSWAEFSRKMRVLYGHPKCHFCGTREACFCEACIAPTWEELHKWYCHKCHAENSGAVSVDCCPTCKRKWPDEPVAKGKHGD